MTIHIGGEHTTVDVGFSLGKNEVTSPEDILVEAIKKESGELLLDVAQPEMDDLKQKLFDEYNLRADKT